MPLGNGYFVTNNSPLLHSGLRQSRRPIYKIGDLIVQRCIIGITITNLDLFIVDNPKNNNFKKEYEYDYEYDYDV